MDHKAWPWRKKSTEKPNAAAEAADKVNVKGNEEEVEALLAEKEELEKNLKTLSDKLDSALSERSSKDELVKKHAKMAQEAVHGWEKVETEVGFLKQELDKAFHLRAAGEERIAQLDGALKECMQQLRLVRDEQEQKVHDAVMQTSREFQKTQMVLEEKLAEATKRLSKVGTENTQLSNALLVKDKLIEDLGKQLTQVESDINALTTRLESTEKDNTSLKYEVRVLEKELEIRNEEREFTRRTADQSHKQHLEGAKKVAKLESESQRLRLLVRKRLPGPAALVKMKNEVEMLGRDSVGMRRRSLSPNRLMHDSTLDNFSETPSKRINTLTEQLYAMEEENQNLKEALNKKMNELQFSRNMYARAASKLSHVEVPFEEPQKGQATGEPMSSLMSRKLSVASMSDIASEDKVSCADSWASALIAELEHFRNEKQKGWPTSKTVGASDINLMDDFVEMEKLAVVSADQISLGSHASSPANALVGPLETEYSSELVSSETVPASDTESGFSLSNRQARINDIVDGKASNWLQHILQLVLEHSRVAGRNHEQILDDIRIALASTGKPGELIHARTNSSHFDAFNPPSVKSCTSWKGSDRSLVTDSLSVVSDVDMSSPKRSSEKLYPDLSKSLCKIIELIEGISVPSSDYNPENGSITDGTLSSYKHSEKHTGYMVRTFQWKTSELGHRLQQFVHACYAVLNGKAGVDKFTEELTTALDWILNHCFSLQDVSSMKDEIKKQFDWDDTRSESEAEAGMVGQFSDTDKLRASRHQLSCMPMAASSNGHSIPIEEELHANLVKENRRLKDELFSIESAKRELEGRLESADDKSEYLMNQLKESEKAIASLRTELQSLRESKGIIEDQIKIHEMMKEDLDRQLIAAKIESSEAHKKFSSLEVELENKYNCCEELEAACLELQLQLESVKKKSPNSNPNQEERQGQSDWEITAASEKLAECQETILNLGKQLKAMATPREAALFDKVISNPTDINTPTDTAPRKSPNQRSSLLDKMLAEDSAAAKDFMSPKTKEIDSNSTSTCSTKRVIEPLENILLLNNNYQDDNAIVGSLAIVPGKKRGGGSLWRRLLWRKKKGISKKGPPSIAS